MKLSIYENENTIGEFLVISLNDGMMICQGLLCSKSINGSPWICYGCDVMIVASYQPVSLDQFRQPCLITVPSQGSIPHVGMVEITAITLNE